MSDIRFNRVKVLQLSDRELSTKLGELALDFALIGYTDVAFRFLSKLNHHDQWRPSNSSTRPLWFVCHLLGKWPDGEIQRLCNAIKGERKTRSNDGTQRKSKATKVEESGEDDPSEDDVQQYLDRMADVYAKEWWYPSKRNGVDAPSPYTKRLTPQKKRTTARDIIEGIREIKPDHYVNARTGAAAITASSGLVSVLDLVLSLEADDDQDVDPAPSSKAILSAIAQHIEANQQRQLLAQSRRAWTILKDGALAEALGLDRASVSDFAQQLESVIDERLQNGRTQLEDWPMRKILEQIDFNNHHCAEEEDYHVEEVDQFWKQPATDKQIADAETKLGVELPSDYKEFLKITNGCGAMYSGILFEPSLHPVEHLRWTSEDEAYFTELPLDLNGGYMLTAVSVGRTIEIGTEDIDNQWLVPPAKMNEYKEYIRKIIQSNGDDPREDGNQSEDIPKRRLDKAKKLLKEFAGSEQGFWDMDWGCVTWAAGGSAYMVGYPSFKAYLRKIAEDGGGRDGDDLLSREEWWGNAFVEQKSEDGEKNRDNEGHAEGESLRWPELGES